MQTEGQRVREEKSVRSNERGYAGGLTDVTREHGFSPLRVEGKIPDEIAGTLYRAGPGTFSTLDTKYEHWFDANGLISALRVRGGKAEGAVRLLQTPGLLEEHRRGKGYFGSYGTRAPGLWNPVRAVRLARGSSKNPSNTSVLAWGDRTFALCEIGRPFEFDPEDLSSIAETDFGGAIHHAYSAHPHRVAQNGCIYNIGTKVGKPASIEMTVLRPDGTAGRVGQIPIPFATMIHDFAVTENHIVVFLAPLELSLLRLFFGLGSFAENLRWNRDRGTEVIVVPFDAPGSPVRFHVDAFWTWHVGNAFERNGEIIVDHVRYPDFATTNDWLTALTHGGPRTEGGGVLVRSRIDPKKKTLVHEEGRDAHGEFPRVAPIVDSKPNRLMYWAEHSSLAASREGPPDAIASIEVESSRASIFAFERGEFASEPVFVPRGTSAEDDGWLVTQVYDSRVHRSYWAVLDARRVADGPIARAHLDHHVPHSFHGAWVPSA
jgi:all-trans-8'-apo-beta-carotenal 15,15'-oxygenase